MDRKKFQDWLAGVDNLSHAQRTEALAVLSGQPDSVLSLAAIEASVEEDRRCPHCGTPDAVSRGKARGLRRYQCKGCKRTFNAATGTPLSGLHRKERWLSFGMSLAEGETVRESARRCGLGVNTAFRWRHRFLEAAGQDRPKLKGIVEVDETYVLESHKGSRTLDRKARKRGGKASKRGLSDEQVPVLVAADRSGTTISEVLPAVNAETLQAVLEPVLDTDIVLVSDGHGSYPPCAAAMGVRHEALNLSAGERVRDAFHIQTVNSRHSQLKGFLRRIAASPRSTWTAICDGSISSAWSGGHRRGPASPQQSAAHAYTSETEPCRNRDRRRINYQIFHRPVARATRGKRHSLPDRSRGTDD